MRTLNTTIVAPTATEIALKTEFSNYVTTIYQEAFRLNPYFPAAQDISQKKFFTEARKNTFNWNFLVWCIQAFLVKHYDSSELPENIKYLLFIKIVTNYLERQKIPEALYHELKGWFLTKNGVEKPSTLFVIYGLQYINPFYRDMIKRNPEDHAKILLDAKRFEKRAQKDLNQTEKLETEIKRNFIKFVNEQYRYAIFTNDIFNPPSRVTFFKSATKKEENWEFLFGCIRIILLHYYQNFRTTELHLFLSMIGPYLKKEKAPSLINEKINAFLKNINKSDYDEENLRIYAISKISFLYANIIKKHKDNYQRIQKEIKLTERWVNKITRNEDDSNFTDSESQVIETLSAF